MAVVSACGGDDSDSGPDAAVGGSGGGSGGASGSGGKAGKAGTANVPSDGGATAEAGAGGAGGATVVSNDVAGRVVDRDFRPLENVPVSIGALEAVTDENGEFTLTDVDQTYDCTIVVSDDATAYVFKGITRRDPTFQLYTIFETGVPPNSATVDVSLTLEGSASWSADSYPIVLGVPGTSSFYSYVQSPGVERLDPTWSGATTTEGELHVLMFDTVDFQPSDYLGYGTVAVPLADGGTSTLVVDVDPVAEHTLGATIAVPSGYPPYSTDVFMDFATRVSVELTGTGLEGDSFALPVPEVTDANVRAMSVAFGADATSLAFARVSVDATEMELTHREPALLLLPVDNGTGITEETTFKYTESDGPAIYVLDAQPVGASLPRYVIVTQTASAQLPDLSSAGLGLPSNEEYFWQVHTFGPYADVDAATSADGFAAAHENFTKDGAEPVPNGTTLGMSYPRHFTTAP